LISGVGFGDHVSHDDVHDLRVSDRHRFSCGVVLRDRCCCGFVDHCGVGFGDRVSHGDVHVLRVNDRRLVSCGVGFLHCGDS